MRAVVIVDLAPAIKCPLRLGLAGEGREVEHLGLEAAVEALVLAAPLRVTGPCMDKVAPELEQPDAQPCPLVGNAGAHGLPLSV